MRRPLALAVLVLLAGCGGLSGGEPTDTVTPAPVPSSETSERYPPGVGADGVVDPLALGAAHYDVIQESSYTTVRNRTVRRANGSLLVRTAFHGRFSANLSRFHIVYAVDGPAATLFGSDPGRLVLWSDGERLLRSITIDNETERRSFPAAVFNQRPGPFGEQPGDEFGLHSPDREAYWLFTAFRTDARLVENGSTVVEGTALARPEALATLEDVDDPHGASLHAVVGPDGLVRTYHLSYRATDDGRPVRVQRTVRYRAMGTTRIERPSWYGTVVNGTEE